MAIVTGSTVLRDATGDVTDYANGSWPVCEPKTCEYGLLNNFQVNMNYNEIIKVVLLVVLSQMITLRI